MIQKVAEIASVQPTGSIREIAKREFDKLVQNPETQAIAWHYWKRAYDSALVNLPVGTGWTDKDMYEVWREHYGDVYPDLFEKWLEQYKQSKSK